MFRGNLRRELAVRPHGVREPPRGGESGAEAGAGSATACRGGREGLRTRMQRQGLLARGPKQPGSYRILLLAAGLHSRRPHRGRRLEGGGVLRALDGKIPTSTAAAGNGVGANINVNNPNAAVTKALDTGGIIQSSTGLLSLPLGAPLGSTPSNADKKKPMKTDEEILEELEPNVSRPLPPAMLPYFEGDFWVSEGELILKFFMKDDIKKKLEEEEN